VETGRSARGTVFGPAFRFALSASQGFTPGRTKDQKRTIETNMKKGHF